MCMNENLKIEFFHISDGINRPDIHRQYDFIHARVFSLVVHAC